MTFSSRLAAFSWSFSILALNVSGVSFFGVALALALALGLDVGLGEDAAEEVGCEGRVREGASVGESQRESEGVGVSRRESEGVEGSEQEETGVVRLFGQSWRPVAINSSLVTHNS